MDTAEFRRRFYKDTPLRDWNDWHWQLAHRLRTVEDFERVTTLSPEEKKAFTMKNAFPAAVTPYYAALLDNESVRRTVVPLPAEHDKGIGETNDPLGEEPCRVAPHLIHRYPDRVLFLTTGFCSTYCRYCTRSRLVGKNANMNGCDAREWDGAFEYLKTHPQVRDVLVSGGDPLTMSDEKIDYLLTKLREIKSVEMIRIGTKTPVVLPMRLTPALLKIVKKHHPVFFSLHMTHPAELRKETCKACERIADYGIPTGSQTVLLKGVNDNSDTIRALMHGLLKVRVRPYYLFQCDPVEGSSHFRVPLQKGLDIIKSLRGSTSGYAVPTFAVDIPCGGGKVVFTPNQVVGRDGDFILLNNFEDRIYRYPDPAAP